MVRETLAILLTQKISMSRLKLVKEEGERERRWVGRSLDMKITKLISIARLSSIS